MLLDIEARIGYLLPSAEVTRRSGSKKILPEGITDKTAYQSRAIAENPKAVAEVIKEAEENEDIPIFLTYHRCNICPGCITPLIAQLDNIGLCYRLFYQKSWGLSL